ncbi:hypothetical protein DL769_009626 [Monosporascus sp. CRB-8-3]|nr:hypothetical protein DL769_009626 [Monosporascus sp. CRB-8-3]
MTHFNSYRVYVLSCVAGMLFSTARAYFFDDAETEEPDIDCLVGTGLNCELNSFSGLNGHLVNELLYNITQQSNLPNDTFLPNEEYGACLLKDRSFALAMGDSGMLTFDLDWPVDGSR